MFHLRALLRLALLLAATALGASCSDNPSPTGDAALLDLGVVDTGASTDAAKDRALADAPPPDRSAPDQALDDLAPPDQAPPDQMRPDQAMPDQATPDQATPDQTLPDQMPPDQMLPDQMPPDQMIPDMPAPVPPWAVSAGGPDADQGQSLVVDAAGNIYVTGLFEGTADFGSTTLTAKGSQDIFVTKLDRSGTFLWAVGMGGQNRESPPGIAVDSAGQVTIAGQFEGQVAFGSTTLTSKGQYDIFVARLSSAGAFLWATSAGGADSEGAAAVAVDGQGNIHIAGGFSGTTTLGSTTLTSKGQTDSFVAKLTSSGAFTWATSAGGSMHESPTDIAVDAAGNVYITGNYLGSPAFGSTTLSPMGLLDIFVAKLSSSGAFAWAVSAGGSSSDSSYSINLDGAGNIYIGGTIEGRPSFGSTTLMASNADVFVAKLSGAGAFLWAVKAGGSWDDRSYSTATDSAGNTTITGYFYRRFTFGGTTLQANTTASCDVFVAKMDTQGTPAWATSAGGNMPSESNGVAVDSQGHAYVTGRYRYRPTFGSTTLMAKGLYDIFVAKVDKIGTF